MTLNPEYNKILAEALVKEDKRRAEMEMIPMSVIEDIKAEIRKMPNRNPSYTHTCDVVDREDVLEIIDKHISGKEQE